MTRSDSVNRRQHCRSDSVRIASGEACYLAGERHEVGAGRMAKYVNALLAVALTLAAVGLLRATTTDLPTAILLYLVPIILAASRWGRGPAVAAVLMSVLGHDLLFVEPTGTLTIARPEEALGLVLLLFTALVTAQLADTARQGAAAAHDAAVARRSDELKTALLRAVSHDLRTPLGTIKASGSGLRQADAAYTSEDRAELLAAIEEEADRLDRLVGNLLDASRLEGGALKPHKRPQDLGELVAATVDRLYRALAGREVRVEMPEDLPWVPCDYAQIDQVVTNLLENAALHTPPGTGVLIRALADKDVVRAEVVDEGPGVAVADRERVFQPFERGPTLNRGSGLGLAIARGLVEAHGGRLWVEDAPGGGARFVFTLPVRSTAV
jgi:K+-sensing histidine kinase KdpD